MKSITILLLVLATAVSVHAEELDTLSIDLPKETVATSIRHVANVFELNVVIPDSALDQHVSVLVKKKDPIEILKAIAVASGYEFIEDNGIYIFKDKVHGCVCQALKR